jgi:hypothetical protein
MLVVHKMNTLDLHGIRYKKAKILVEDFIASCFFPARIVTGNSFLMKEIVEKVASEYNLKCDTESDWNLGAIIIKPLD